MTKSESIGKLAKALSMAQKEIKGAAKDSNNPFFKTHYADLSSVWEACREPLTKNNLAIVQTFDTTEHGVIVETTLIHESGEWISGRLQMNPTKDDPQGRGSAITYGRRYSLAAIVGVCPEDDDGETAMGRKDDKFFLAMEKERQRVGDDAFFAMLGVHGYEKPHEIEGRDKRAAVWNDLKLIADKEAK